MNNKTNFCESRDVTLRKINNWKETDETTNYYKAYEKRYSQVYEKNMLWSSRESTPDILKFINDYKISKNDKILDLGCGEGRDAISLLNKGYNVFAVDYSRTVIEKCKELSDYKFNDRFKQFDLISDRMRKKFDYIYSIAVLHMFVLDEHRKKFLSFISEHLRNNGKCLICVLGDGDKEYSSNIEEAFTDKKRVVMNNNKSLDIASTSCKIVNWKYLEEEIKKSGLEIEKKWISTEIPEFDNSMCVVVKKGGEL